MNARWMVMAGGLLVGGAAFAAGADTSSGSTGSTDMSNSTSSQGTTSQPTGKAMRDAEKSAHKGARKWIAGTVASVAPNKITVDAQDGNPRDLAVDDQTNYLRNGQPIGADQVKEGDHVRASYLELPDGTHRANAIIVMRSASSESSSTGSAGTSGSEGTGSTGMSGTEGTGSMSDSGSTGSLGTSGTEGTGSMGDSGSTGSLGTSGTMP